MAGRVSHGGRRTRSGLSVELDSVSLRLGGRIVLHDVSFRVEPGQRWLLLGANGAGKTALVKLLRGDLWPTPTRQGRRHYRLDGEPVPPFEARSRIACLGAERQDKYERYGWNLRVADVVATGLEDSDLPSGPAPRAVRRRVLDSLAAVGLAGLAARRFLGLSYGQRRRVLLARALVARPALLLLDEVTNGLDDPSRRRLLRTLGRTGGGPATWVYSTHRLGDAPRGVTHVLELEQGRIAFVGPAADYSRRVPGGRAGQRPPARAQRSPILGWRSPARSSGELVGLSRVSLFRDGRAVLREIDWNVSAGECWCVSGANGSGKSSLLGLVYGDLPAAVGGEVRRAGLERGVPISSWKNRVGLVSSELQALYAATACTLEEIVASGEHSSIGLDSPPSAAARRRARQALARLGLAGLARRRAREVSYGQLRRALVARALWRPRDLLLLDEPFDGLDAETRRELLEWLREASACGTTIVLTAHHDADVPAWVTRRLRLLPGGTAQIGSLAS